MSNGKQNDVDIDTLRGDIADTRQRISGEIEAIGERLTPGHARDVAKERMVVAKDRAIVGARSSARNAGYVVRHAPSELPATIRANPIPSAMVLVGTGWLVSKVVSKVRASRRLAEPEYVLGTEEYVSGTEYSGTEYVPGHRQGLVEETHTPSARERVGEVASKTKERVGSAASRTRERISGSAQNIKGRASDLASKGKDRASQARVRSEDAFSSNPLAFGALALFTGIGIGMMLPHTRREDRMLGAPRERVVERAKHLAHEAKEVAVHSAKEGMRVAQDTAKEEGANRDLTGKNI
jgi:uncharacterized protein YjbJ (UPF0337 family)